MMDNQGYNSQGTSIWKTIDDVNATFDALSIMNGGKIKLKSPKSNILEENNTILCEYCQISNCIHQVERNELNSNMFIQEQDCINSEVLSFKNGCLGNRSLEDIDTSLQAELEQVFPGGFSNERIEKHWQLRDKDENGVKSDLYLGTDDDELTNFDDCIKFKTNNNKEIFFKYEDEVRACSPPLTTPASSGDTSPRSSSSCFVSPVQEGLKLDDLEKSAHSRPKSYLTCHSKDCSASSLDAPEIKNSVEGICASANNSSSDSNVSNDDNLIASEVGNTGQDLLPSLSLGGIEQPKTSYSKRNALLNGLFKRGLIKNQQVDKVITLKKPEDFLIPFPNGYSNIASKSTYNNPDDFVYCKEDFPAL